ncbi:hypothetical protein NFJ02_05g120340 [Pycnococcus provasolii]
MVRSGAGTQLVPTRQHALLRESHVQLGGRSDDASTHTRKQSGTHRIRHWSDAWRPSRQQRCFPSGDRARQQQRRTRRRTSLPARLSQGSVLDRALRQ